MIGKGNMGIMCHSLDINFKECDWFITIRRTDGKEDRSFGALNEQEVGPAQIANFIPNWQNLEWQRGRLEGISEGACIQGRDYKLNLICPKESHIDADIAIKEFTEFMTNKLKKMEEQVKDELEHIPDWPEPQNELRAVYHNRRMHSLSKEVVLKQTAKEVLQRCVSFLKVDYPDFQFKYDEDFFNKCG